MLRWDFNVLKEVFSTKMRCIYLHILIANLLTFRSDSFPKAIYLTPKISLNACTVDHLIQLLNFRDSGASSETANDGNTV